MSRSRELWRVVAGRRTGRATTRLAMGAAFAVATMALLFAVAANLGIERRGDRVAWRTPTAAAAGQPVVARMATLTSAAAGRPLIETTYAPLTPDAPVPPGLSTRLAPGEFAVSPALAELAADRPPLARFRGATAIIGSDGLAHADELAVVRGAAPDDPRLTTDQVVFFWGSTPPTDIARFSTSVDDGDLLLYRVLVALGTVILVLPALTMTSAAARLVADRQARDLAVARLVGARRNQIASIAAWDVAGPAAMGVAGGTAATLAVLPLASRIPVQGGPFRFSDLAPSPGWWAVCALTVTFTAIATTVLTVRRSVADPLAVATNSRRRTAGWWRAGVFVVGITAFVQTMGSESVSVTRAIVMWSVAIVALDMVGPLLMRLLAALRIASARSGVGLVAARRMADNPVAAYRQVGSLALAAFVAGMLLSTTNSLDTAETNQLSMRVGISADDAVAADSALEGLDGVVSVDVVDADEFSSLEVILQSPETADSVRAVLAEVAPGSVALTNAEEFATGDTAVADFRRASVMLFLAVALAAAVSIGAASVGSIIDQQKGLTALRTLGVPLDDLRRARRRAVVTPVILAGVVSATAGSLLGAVATQSTAPASSVAVLAIVIGAAIACALVAQESTVPLLRRMTSDRRVLQA